MDTFYNVGKYEISNMCLQTYPCKHRVYNKETGVSSIKSGVAIYSMLKNEGLSHEHFNEFATYKVATHQFVNTKKNTTSK
jgi:hypothetical protein